ncbi:hypothetical protein PSG02_02240 [Proteus mirabilis]|nr:hypothetical protein [Proteus mirabilis]
MVRFARVARVAGGVSDWKRFEYFLSNQSAMSILFPFSISLAIFIFRMGGGGGMLQEKLSFLTENHYD